MKRFLILSILLFPILAIPAKAETIKWVDFDVSYESMKYALEQDIVTFEQEKHVPWIDALALAACRTGGKCGLASVKQAVADLKTDKSPEELLGDLYKYYDYYHQAYTAALGGLVGSYAIEKDGEWVATYGLKAFSPIAAGYGYSHCDDFGVARSFGFKRKHLGNDLMGRWWQWRAAWWKPWAGTATVAGGLESVPSTISATIIMPICRKIHPLRRGWKWETLCRREISSASWAGQATVTGRMSTISRPCTYTLAWS